MSGEIISEELLYIFSILIAISRHIFSSALVYHGLQYVCAELLSLDDVIVEMLPTNNYTDYFGTFDL